MLKFLLLFVLVAVQVLVVVVAVKQRVAVPSHDSPPRRSSNRLLLWMEVVMMATLIVFVITLTLVAPQKVVLLGAAIVDFVFVCIVVFVTIQRTRTTSKLHQVLHNANIDRDHPQPLDLMTLTIVVREYFRNRRALTMVLKYEAYTSNITIEWDGLGKDGRNIYRLERGVLYKNVLSKFGVTIPKQDSTDTEQEKVSSSWYVLFVTDSTGGCTIQSTSFTGTLA